MQYLKGVKRREIRINKLGWIVQTVQRNHEKMDGSLGKVYFNDLLIFIDESLSEELFRQTVIHELVHAFAFSFGIHLFANEETEESVCDFIGAHLDAIYKLTNKIMAVCYKGGKKA